MLHGCNIGILNPPLKRFWAMPHVRAYLESCTFGEVPSQSILCPSLCLENKRSIFRLIFGLAIFHHDKNCPTLECLYYIRTGLNIGKNATGSFFTTSKLTSSRLRAQDKYVTQRVGNGPQNSLNFSMTKMSFNSWSIQMAIVPMNFQIDFMRKNGRHAWFDLKTVPLNQYFTFTGRIIYLLTFKNKRLKYQPTDSQPPPIVLGHKTVPVLLH